jgi:cell wall-associated NlpC family hydrolase
MKWMLAIFGVLFLNLYSFGQDKKIDQLEIFYDQGYYQKTFRKSNKLLADPAFDYSGLPSYYRSLSLFRMAADARWRKRHKTAISDAVISYENFAKHSSYTDYLQAHYYEISSLKSYLSKLGKELDELGNRTQAKTVFQFNMDYLISIKAMPDRHETLDNPELANTSNSEKDYRSTIVAYAKTLVGIKYVWAGADETGFDCSGFTSYVLKKYGIAIPRTASGQMEDSDKVKITQANKGDLIFFGSGAKITHVGIVVSSKGEDLSMIHASTSKGVIVTNIEKSTYWNPKLKGAGTYLTEK